ncbi:MAG: hypothetical protein AB1Z98_07810 [Nannocystaceae bacterium]
MISIALTHSLLALSTSGPAPLDDLYEPPLMETGVSMFCEDDGDCRVFPDQPLCDPELMECVECIDETDCDPGWACTEGGDCVDACTTDEDCDGIGGASTCDPEQGQCVGCLDADDCAPEEFCMESTCLPDHCTPGQMLCFDNTLLLCLEDGGSTMVVEECAETCEQTDAGAQCTQPGADGSGGGTGAGTGGVTGGTSPDPTATGTATDGSEDGSAGGSAGTAPADDGVTDGGGCSCTTAPGRGGAWARGGVWAWLLLLGAGLRRRRPTPGQPKD